MSLPAIPPTTPPIIPPTTAPGGPPTRPATAPTAAPPKVPALVAARLSSPSFMSGTRGLSFTGVFKSGRALVSVGLIFRPSLRSCGNSVDVLWLNSVTGRLVFVITDLPQ